MGDLTGKTALVTGSVQGIGLAVAKALASAGARVGVHGLASQDEANAAVGTVLSYAQYPCIETEEFRK